ncbi:X-ray repair cross-complementing protein 6 isoform X1 [Pogoniulus pusillus]|uniref:X-ray repair cross-complementing protein 6 isoform X1 n=1 Tax=Pogoniulus pusillus TaxID=488313 RepID=UPI0030B94DBC
MSEWVSYYRSEAPEEDDGDEQQQEEGTEAVGDYRFSGRDSLIFLVDASKAMFEKDEEGVTPFEMTIQCIRNVYTSKIISSDRDLLSVVLYGTENSNNSADFKHVYVLQDLDNPGAKRILELDQYRGDEGQALFHKTFGHNADYSLGEALWACSNLFSDVRVRLSHKRIMLFTNEDDPHASDSAKAKLARTRAGDLRDTGIILDLMHLKKPGGFDISLFYRDIINLAEDEDLGIQPKESEKLEHLMKKVRAKQTKKRAMVRLNLYLNKDLSLSVGVYNLIQKAYKPYPVKLYRETNEPVKTKTRTFNAKTGSLLLPSDTKRAQTYGNRQIVLEKEETEEIKQFDPPGLFLIGFKPLSMLKPHHHIKPSQFIYPEESLVSGFHVVFLPYADDKRKVDFTEKLPASQEQVDKMKQIIQKLRFKYRTDSFENPVLQQHFRNMEALALDMMEPEQAEDLTMPKVEEMNHRLGNLVEEFKQLVYPPDYNPEGKAVKRKQTSNDQTEKRPRVEISKDELRSHAQNGTLGKLIVPVLKDACRLYGLKGGGKKQELMDALTEYFNDH